MRIKCFAIPALTPEAAAEEVSKFLASHRILTVDREFIADGPASHWALCVTYLPSSNQPTPIKRPKVDYRELLSPEDFAVYSRLRALRKEFAEHDGIPPYAVFTNEQLAAMVTQRIEKYGQAFIDALKGAPERAAT